MILFALFVSLLHSILSAGVPVATDSDVPGSGAASAPVFLTDYRSTIQMVWTCFAIIFASTWVCIHPNVPGHRAKKLGKIALRGRLFFNALLFPDQFVARAFREWRGAQAINSRMQDMIRETQIKRDAEPPATGEGVVRQAVSELGCNESVEGKAASHRESKQDSEPAKSTPWEWTIVHAHFIQMGGVVFQSSTEGEIWYKDFKDWTNQDVKSFFKLKLTEEKLRDWSKADGLAKAFVIVQSLWFVLQCIGRTVFRLPLIELEVTCFAFIACNIGMHAFWWDKPLNVNCPEVIQLEAPEAAEGFNSSSSGETAEGSNSSSSSENADTSKSDLGWGWWFKMLLKTLATGDLGILLYPSLERDDTITAPSPRFPVNYYYRGKEWDKKWDKHVEDLTQTVPLAIFGSLHAIAWFGAFPSVYEKVLWRASSIVPATQAFLLLALFYLRRGLTGNSRPPKAGDSGVLKKLLHFLVYLVLPVNLVARYVFVILPVLQLRDLPPLAHQTVPWAEFLPHV